MVLKLAEVCLLTCLCDSSFDRHALDLLEKMLTLDPSQVNLLASLYVISNLNSIFRHA